MIGKSYINALRHRWRQLTHRPLSVTTDRVFKGLGAGDVAIDCGANVGLVTERLARTGATVYAFEPNPVAFEILKEKFSRVSNVHCLQQGVWDRNSTLKLFLHREAIRDPVQYSTGSSFLGFKGNVDTSSFVEVPLVDLVAFIANLGHFIKFLKIDIEGAECELVEKLIHSNVLDQIGMVYVETHDHKIPQLVTRRTAFVQCSRPTESTT